MKHVIIGTAGHVDHGKTTLIQALTGVNTDRLQEEQERGMTIDLGFASLRLPDGTIAGIVDVPGHERFLKNMLAGASGVDVVLLVIAADEGVMPQTLEHLDILRLLDVKNGVIALTKCDMVDKEWMYMVEADIRTQLKDTFLETAPIVQVAAPKNRGIDNLKKTLLQAVSRATARNSTLPFRLPIDRVFTRAGFGTVVTGTLVAGTIRTGESVEITPQQVSSRVRGLQVHGEKVKEAFAGMRVAINIAGVETAEIERGAQLVPPNTLIPTTLFDAVLQLLPNLNKPIKDRARVRVHIGTDEVIGRIALLESGTELAENTRTYIQFRSEKPLACARGDRFVVRQYSPMVTIGGGIVLDPNPARHRKDDAPVLSSLQAKENGTPEDLIETVLQRHPLGILRKDLPRATGLSSEVVDTTIQTLYAQGRTIALAGDRIMHSAVLETLTKKANLILNQYHEQFPLRAGVPKEEYRSALGREVDLRIFASLLNHWEGTKVQVVEGATVRLATFKVQLNEKQEAILTRIEAYYRQCGIVTPPLAEVGKAVLTHPDSVEPLLRVGVELGRF
ncbi:MAG: selenocysteine-specific translation elongation factor, partial [Armatimonadetes bacterium]|nr:selenocysteine-specific translation elongation factor [Armatimonadota bacterium]